MRKLNLTTLAATLAVAVSVALPAAAQEADGPILFTNVNVFDGVNESLIENANVVVTDNLITAISTEPLAVAGGTVTLLTAPNTIHGRLHIVIDPTPRNAAKHAEGMPVSIEQHLVRLQRVRAHQKCSAVRQLAVRQLSVVNVLCINERTFELLRRDE